MFELNFIHELLFVVFSSQVETVGDKYMAVSGLPTLCVDHAKNIARLALDMLDMAKSVEMNGKPMVGRNFY